MKIKSILIFLFITPIIVLGYSSSYYYQNSVDGIALVNSSSVVSEKATGVFNNFASQNSKGFFYYDCGIQNVNSTFYFNSINFSGQIYVDPYSLFMGRVESSVLDESGNLIQLGKNLLGLSGQFHNFYWGGKLIYASAENSVFDAFANGWGVSLGLRKKVKKTTFGLNYSSPIVLNWDKNSDLIFYNYISPEFNLGTSYALSKNKVFFLGLRYMFPQVRMSGTGVVRNVLLYNQEINLSLGMKLGYSLEQFTFVHNIGLAVLQNNKLGTVEEGNLIVKAGTGLNLSYADLPMELKIGYNCDITSKPMQIFKIGLLYNF